MDLMLQYDKMATTPQQKLRPEPIELLMGLINSKEINDNFLNELKDIGCFNLKELKLITISFNAETQYKLVDTLINTNLNYSQCYYNHIPNILLKYLNMLLEENNWLSRIPFEKYDFPSFMKGRFLGTRVFPLLIQNQQGITGNNFFEGVKEK